VRARWSISIALVLLSVALAPLVASADGEFSSSGGTSVSVEGSSVTITVSIDLALGGQGETTVPEGSQAVADELAQQIADYWNQGFERLSSVCVQFKLVVKINVVPQADAHLLFLDERRATWVTTPGRHVVFWGEDNFGNAAPPETYDEYDVDGIAPPGEDYGAPLEHELWSIWSPHLENARDFAHELGHLLGFGDDSANGEPLPGREGTLMDSGDLVDQNLVTRLAEIVRNSGKRLPECWEGTVTIDNKGICVAHWTVRLAVDAEGAVTGRSKVESDSCGGAISVDLTGTKTEQSFTLAGYGGITVTVPIVGGNRAHAVMHPHPVTDETWDLECKTCDE
jgi:hypothetical protein